MITITINTEERDRWSGTIEPTTVKYQISLSAARSLLRQLQSDIPREEARVAKKKADKIEKLESELKSLKGET